MGATARIRAVNLGVIVTPDEGTGGEMRISLSDSVRARIKAAQPDYDFESLRYARDDLRAAVGVDSQMRFGEDGMRPASSKLLADVAARLDNQLQLTPPRRYLAASLEAAAEKLFGRYVTHRPPRARLAV